uniref:thiamine biosynthesis protein S n=1 Tax=Bangia atropurpurea TaxID=31347 RepID=UPI001FCCD980|nr:thiamine biosynthesis protein S [Bangia atropurpurea]UNJ18365.1 thiamine biosynthesis protein S [Bangia atropurpurea]
MINKNISIQINGEPFNCSEPLSLQFLLNYLDFNSERVAIELNDILLPSPLFHSTYLNDKDKLEIITIVGGG